VRIAHGAVVGDFDNAGIYVNDVPNGFFSGMRLVATDGVLVRHNSAMSDGDRGIDLLDNARNTIVARNVTMGEHHGSR
jgi:hypothetical protein